MPVIAFSCLWHWLELPAPHGISRMRADMLTLFWVLGQQTAVRP